MHLIWENTIKNLVLLWTGNFKKLDEGEGSYQLQSSVWDAIGAATSSSGSTIPGCYGARPPNFAADKTATTADSWSFWTLYLGPVLLRRCFRDEKYYRHFIDLVKLLHKCLEFSLTTNDINDIREGFVTWVETYETFYYQRDPARISACPVTIHALLHIADSIEACGPVWAYWAFPMERYCGLIRPAIKSRKHPFASLDRFIVESAQILHIRLVYNLTDESISLRSRPAGSRQQGFRDERYPMCALLPPVYKLPPDESTLGKLAKALATRYDKSNNIRLVKATLKAATIEEWAKVRIDDGDTISAAARAQAADDGRRDATYVRYEVLVDQNARRRKVAPVFEMTTFYGRVQHIFAIRMPRCVELGIAAPETIFLAGITQCQVEATHSALDIQYYKQESKTEEIVDIQCIQCLVGRVRDVGNPRWAIIDRSGSLSRALYEPDAE
ncbi:hypothetical protein FA95DRAFT_1583188 [Auriscalpium vulgare]|uniref:Uncharacterized protein n=1 Tax=Auriscalpium vulgare TaxID=40419 RepID=A0ACB8RQN0_9AGAM|nr:hypothetical protein FA95DRAFT_1583188 [Auriscalpium vulgare]